MHNCLDEYRAGACCYTENEGIRDLGLAPGHVLLDDVLADPCSLLLEQDTSDI